MSIRDTDDDKKTLSKYIRHRNTRQLDLDFRKCGTNVVNTAVGDVDLI